MRVCSQRAMDKIERFATRMNRHTFKLLMAPLDIIPSKFFYAISEQDFDIFAIVGQAVQERGQNHVIFPDAFRRRSLIINAIGCDRTHRKEKAMCYSLSCGAVAAYSVNSVAICGLCRAFLSRFSNLILTAPLPISVAFLATLLSSSLSLQYSRVRRPCACRKSSHELFVSSWHRRRLRRTWSQR